MDARDSASCGSAPRCCLFGLRLIPMALPRRRVFQLAGTLAFASAVFEQSHAEEIRMYQMVQFFVMLLAVVLFKAVKEPTTGRIVAVMVVTVCMYLTHEESFGVLLLVPIALFGFLGFRWCRDWRWWVFGGLGDGSHRPPSGTGRAHPPSGLRSGLEWRAAGAVVTRPFYYLTNVFFSSGGAGPTLTVVSLLAVVGTVIAWRKRDRTLIYLAAFWIVPVVVVSLFLPAKNPRYVFVSVPFEFVLASRAAAEIFTALRRAVSSR